MFMMNLKRVLVSSLRVMFISIIGAALFIGGCKENDDFAPYVFYELEIGAINITESIDSFSQLLPYSSNIVESHANNLKLTMIILTTDDVGLTGDIQFEYTGIDEDINQITVIRIFYDIAEKQFYYAEFEQGHGKRISAITEPISNTYIDMSFQELFSLEEVNCEDSDSSIEIRLFLEEITVKHYD